MEVHGSPSVINSFLGWRWLISPKFPVIFHAISGQDEREASSPSYFNIDEVTVVKDYIQKLKADHSYPIREFIEAPIGVITDCTGQWMRRSASFPLTVRRAVSYGLQSLK